MEKESTSVPRSHEEVSIAEVDRILAFTVDELGIIAQVLIKRGVDPLVVQEAFISVSGTMRSRVTWKK